MRVLFVTWPWRTHYQPIAPLGWALQTAGHEVRIASGPELTDVITKSGLTAVPVGSDVPVLQKLGEMFSEEHQAIVDALEKLGPRDDLLFEFAANSEEKLTWDRMRWLTRYLTEILKGMNESMIEDLVEYARWWKPDLVIWDWLSPAGSIAATAIGAPHARIRIEIDVDARFRRKFVELREQQAPEDREDALADWLGEWARKYGASFSEEMVTGQFTVEQMIGSLRIESDVPHVPLRLIPYNGPAAVPDWTRSDPEKRRVLATFGVSQEKGEEYQAFSVEQLQEMLDSLADLDIELVVTLPESLQKEIERVPANTRMVDFVPLHVIIPSCSAVIHHGGVPAFLDAIAHEVPQLMVGRVVPDIEDRAARAEEAGVAQWIPATEISGSRIREELVRLLEDPSYREAAGRLREEMLAMPTPAEVVVELERRVAKSAG
ncbi:activator-dependent family glycosyltransferase [Streptomyces sp. NPDC050658]|uniref:activator-dependent family glycosyltransferase n=1 Tax=unclassified Streptomyces TaxID=2593676 RepID=UPI003419796D